MSYVRLSTVVTFAAVLAITGCSRTSPTGEANRVSDANDQQKHNDDIDSLQKRVADLKVKWIANEHKLATDKTEATTAMRTEVKEDIKNVEEAVADLRTTTPNNWFERTEAAMERTLGDIDQDVKRLSRKRTADEPIDKPPAATASDFAAHRDRLVSSMQSQVDRMKRDLEGVKARGPKDTELDDTRARIEKLGDDVAELRNASPDDWWTISLKRVSGYVDRLEDSVNRLDDNKK